MSLATTQRQSRRNKAPYYPELPDTTHRLFWLACFLRDCAEHETLIALANEAYRRRRPNLVQLALTQAQLRASDVVRDSARYVLQEGLILFAHGSTTTLKRAEVPA